MAKLQVGINDLKTVSPEIAKEWHLTLNGAMKPCDLTDRTSREVWWLCQRGHSYRMSVSKRTVNGRGCPDCRKEDHSGAKMDVCFVAL